MRTLGIGTVLALGLGLLGLANEGGAEAAKAPVFVFRDVSDETGLLPPLAGIRGHAAAWGDIDGDGWPSLFVGTYHTAGKPGQLLRNVRGKFTLDKQEHLRVSACASGALFVDLTNSGRLDLYVSNNAHGKAGVRSKPSALFRNEGGGKFTDVSKDSGACPPGFMGRSVAAADFDGDGLLDLLACEYYYTPAAKKGLALYRNKGKHQFEDVTKAVGLPTGFAVAGVAVADVNGDGWPDIFLTTPDGNNRLYLNDGRGNFREAPGTRNVFAWKCPTTNDAPTGVCIADVNRDGLPDIVVGHHYKQPWQAPASIRLYLNRGVKEGVPVFEDVTEAAGLTALAMKAPHVEIQDFDNDGWPDIYTSIVKRAALPRQRLGRQ
jgi:enediyne biosynthesis protein E4